MKNTRVLFVSQEIMPYLPETDMSHIARYLPQSIQENGGEIRAFMPRYGLVNERRNQLHEVIRLSGMNIIIDDTDHPLIIKVASIQSARMQVYFIDNEDFFMRKSILKDKSGKIHIDNDERAIFFARGVLETVKKLRWKPDVVHCFGWITSLVPLYIKKAYSEDPIFQNTKVVYSVYDDIYKERLQKGFKRKIKVDGVSDKDISVLTELNYLNTAKIAVNMSDGIIKGVPEIDDGLSRYIKNARKPLLDFSTKEEALKTYPEFYEKILKTSEE